MIEINVLLRQIRETIEDMSMFDPKAWAKMAKEAGMKYVVITSKHHEGFCLWDSKYTDYKATNTPIKKDLLKEYVEAFRAEGLKVGFYYSLLDWHHPDFTIDRCHPQRLGDNATEADYAKLNKGKDMTTSIGFALPCAIKLSRICVARPNVAQASSSPPAP